MDPNHPLYSKSAANHNEEFPLTSSQTKNNKLQPETYRYRWEKCSIRKFDRHHLYFFFLFSFLQVRTPTAGQSDLNQSGQMFQPHIHIHWPESLPAFLLTIDHPGANSRYSSSRTLPLAPPGFKFDKAHYFPDKIEQLLFNPLGAWGNFPYNSSPPIPIPIRSH